MSRLPRGLLVVVLAAALAALPGRAPAAGGDAAPSAPPPAEAMVLDALLVRPLMLVTTAVGTGIYVVSLPFSLIGGNAAEAGRRLVIDPARYTFTRPLGRFSSRRERR